MAARHTACSEMLFGALSRAMRLAPIRALHPARPSVQVGARSVAIIGVTGLQHWKWEYDICSM